MENNKTAWVFAANQDFAAEILEKFKNEIGKTQPIDAQFFTNNSTVLNHAKGSPLSIYALPPATPDFIVISARLPLLNISDFSLVWLAGLARYNDVYIRDLKTAHNPKTIQLSSDHLNTQDDLFSVSMPRIEWIKICLSNSAKAAHEKGTFSALMMASRPTLAFWLPEQIDEFRKRYKAATEQYVDKERFSESVVDAQFVYTLHGIWQKGLFLEKRLGSDFKDTRMLDMGGGYGALGIELALRGAHVTIVEIEEAKLKYLAQWMVDRHRLSDRVSLVPGDFKAIQKIDGPYDVISFFCSLLYESRDQVEMLLQQCKDKLVPGGKLIVQEIPKIKASVSARDYDIQFEGGELNALVKKVFSKVSYFSLFTMSEVDLEKANNSVLFLEATD
ncbi:class I SAM-dependent methyltransferase [Tateyamaria sp.]|nr:class I SAM-dependent methyltransferase [Tateyamaria sp.]